MITTTTSIYYYIQLHSHQTDNNSMKRYWNNIDTEVGDGVVVCGVGVDINEAYQEQ